MEDGLEDELEDELEDAEKVKRSKGQKSHLTFCNMNRWRIIFLKA